MTPPDNVNSTLTRSLLPAAVFLLLTAVMLPGTGTNAFAKGACLEDPLVAVIALPDTDNGKRDGDDQKANRAPEGVVTLSAPRYSVATAYADPQPDSAFTSSRARAPPRP
ncbi:MAG: hypothetical protein R3E50_05910 [Halioglobus sp.]